MSDLRTSKDLTYIPRSSDPIQPAFTPSLLFRQRQVDVGDRRVVLTMAILGSDNEMIWTLRVVDEGL
ncbi:hypothetical protein NMY22_g18463 [Coprinellus aureogranulatus]|nr:hypothetical protein NMY22_g18463 [Coprinellus aureogranulatus]